MGPSPRLVQRNFEPIQEINRSGVTVFVVEQDAAMALAIAHRGYVLRTGEIVMSGSAPELLRSQGIRQAYLGEMYRRLPGLEGRWPHCRLVPRRSTVSDQSGAVLLCVERRR